MRGHAQAAMELAAELYHAHPDDPEILTATVQTALEFGDTESAARWLDQAADQSTEAVVAGRLAVADELLFERHQPADAEIQYRRVLAVRSHNSHALNHLAWLLGVSGRSEESNRQILRLFDAGDFEFIHPVVLCLDHDRIRDSDIVRSWEAASPSDPATLLAKAALLQAAGDAANAIPFVRRACILRPDWPDAAARCGELLVHLGDNSEIRPWIQSVSSDLKTSPRVLAVLGQAHLHVGQQTDAARCLLQSLNKDSTQRDALYLLGRTLVQLGEKDNAQRLLQRAADIEEYERTVRTAWNTQSVAAIRQAAESAEKLELIPEASAWKRILADHSQHAASQESVAGVATEKALPSRRSADVRGYFAVDPDLAIS
ncbi:MAG: hypothetical protein KDA89_18825, partial [Planctomycetaceae bacterium]|nr:hypothetical protein [Planctomycetaceae bacterium]